jgi:glutaminyl-tRNA synthetase
MEDKAARTNFIWDIIDQDLREERVQAIRTRFPPEPNGYLHIGHCKAVLMNFITAEKYGGLCNLRFDDTNPAKEETEYVNGIMEDIRWLGCEWKGGLYFASDYYEKCYEIACAWIKRGLAYVDELSPEQMREYRGTLTEPGKDSPFRGRAPAQNMDLFAGMREGIYAEGRYTLRAKIDMASPNINMRDPVLFRILHKEHHRTGNRWCIYPMYDFAHPVGDAMERITHSLCSLEYEDHRPLYDWVVNNAADLLPGRPRQIEFARLNLTQTVMSKRYLRRLVEEGHVAGWDDPRMPTLCALRRRGYTPVMIRDFIDRVGVAKADSVVDLGLLEHCAREALGASAPRVMAVMEPLPVILDNWPDGKTETLMLENHPEQPEMGTHAVTFSKNFYIERGDFMAEPVKKFFRLFPGGEVRLKGAYIIRCESYETDDSGQVTRLHCSVDLSSKSGSEGAGRKVKGTLHWIGEMDAVPFEARLYEPLLLNEKDADGQADPKDFAARLNPCSLTVIKGLGEPALASAAVGGTFQFMRTGYFCKDPDSTPVLPVYNRTVSLKDSWSKIIRDRSADK